MQQAKTRLIKQMGYVTDMSYREALGTAVSAINKLQYLEERIKALESKCERPEKECSRKCIGCNRAYVCREEVLKLVEDKKC